MSTAYSFPKPPKSRAMPGSGRKILPGSRRTLGQPTRLRAVAIRSAAGTTGWSAFQFQSSINGSAVGSSTPRVMTYSVSQRSSSRFMSSSTSTQARPAAAVMRLTRLSGRKREYFASKAWTQVTAASANAVAWVSPSGATYWISHTVPRAWKVSLRNGAVIAATTPAAFGTNWVEASEVMAETLVGWRESPRQLHAGGHDGRPGIRALRRDAIADAHDVLLEREIQAEVGRDLPDCLQADRGGPQGRHAVVGGIEGPLRTRRSERGHDRSLIELVMIKIGRALLIQAQFRLENEFRAEALQPGELERVGVRAKCVVIEAVAAFQRAVQIGERTIQRHPERPFVAPVRPVLPIGDGQEDSGSNLHALLHQFVRIAQVTGRPTPAKVAGDHGVGIEQLGKTGDEVEGAFLRSVRLVEHFHVVIGPGHSEAQRGVLLVESGESCLLYTSDAADEEDSVDL